VLLDSEDVPLGEVNIGLLANQVGVTATNTLDLGQGDHDLLLAVNIGVEQTQDVLEVRLLVGHERCNKSSVSFSFNFTLFYPYPPCRIFPAPRAQIIPQQNKTLQIQQRQ